MRCYTARRPLLVTALYYTNTYADVVTCRPATLYDVVLYDSVTAPAEGYSLIVTITSGCAASHARRRSSVSMACPVVESEPMKATSTSFSDSCVTTTVGSKAR